MLRKLLLLSFIFVCLQSCNSTASDPNSNIQPVEARSAYDFVNSIGINTHFGFYETNYWDRWNDLTFPRLKELGVKHIRDGYGYRVPLGQARFIEAGQAGIKLLLSVTTDTPTQLRPKLDALLPYLSGVEAKNEVDYTAPTQPWVDYAKTKQQELFEFIKNTPKYSHLPVVALSLANIRDNASLLGDISEWVDYGNIHTYASGRHPSIHWGYDQTWENVSHNAKVIFKDKPIMSTEAGYHNYEALGIPHLGVPEEVSAIYLPHLFFEYFNKGIVRTYSYEFLDQPRRAETMNEPEMEFHFGLIRLDGEPKPAFYALKNLIALLDDADEDFVPSPLKFEIETEIESVKKYIQHTLLQKSDGSWWIALYRTNEIYDPTFLQQKPIQPVKLTLNFDKKANTIDVYVPNKSVDSEMTLNGRNSVEFDLGAELVLVKIAG